MDERKTASLRYIHHTIPVLPSGVRAIYDLSCFSYMLVEIAVVVYGTHGTITGLILAMVLPIQCVVSYLADSVEFFSTMSVGFWQKVDRPLAVCNLSIAILFVRSLNLEHVNACGAVQVFWIALGCAIVSWCGGVIILRTCPTMPITWAFCHIMWHILPAVAGFNLLKTVEEKI